MWIIRTAQISVQSTPEVGRTFTLVFPPQPGSSAGSDPVSTRLNEAAASGSPRPSALSAVAGLLGPDRRSPNMLPGDR
jgi:hypothetical protein